MPRSNAVFVPSTNGTLTIRTLRNNGEYMVLVGNMVDLPQQLSSTPSNLLAAAFTPVRLGLRVLTVPVQVAQAIETHRRRAKFRVVR